MKALLLFLALVGQQPDRRGEVTTADDAYQGVKASAPIPPQYHIRNEGGSDGAGLCVYSSVIMAGAAQGVADLRKLKDSELWKYVKARPGGSYPEKLARDLNTVYPLDKYGEKWSQYTGTDMTVLDKLSRAGYRVGSTMNTGQLYNYQPIHHMINIIEYRTGKWACVVDNNDPGKYHWMPAREYDRRAVDGGTAWFFWWHKLPAAAQQTGTFLMSALALLFAAVRRRWLLKPALALCVLLLPSAAGAQCVTVGGRTYCPSPYNSYSRGVASWYPLQVVDQPARPVADWADGYTVYTDADGLRYLRARASSVRYGSGTVFFQPDSWVPRDPRPVTPSTRREGAVMEQGTTNFGIQSEQLAEQPPGGVMTNDPSFSPNGTDGPGEIVLPGPPHAGIARQILLPIACALLVLAIMFRVRMHRRLVAQP